MQEKSRTLEFSTPGRHVAGEIFLVLLTAPIILLVGIWAAGVSGYLAGLLLSNDTVEEPFLLPLCIAISVLGLFFYFIWRWMKCRWKFTLLIDSAELTFGKKPFRETLPCVAVETIREMFGNINNPESFRVEIAAHGTRWKCFFGVHSRNCIEMLRSVCSNAVYIDGVGNEHLPEKTHSPIKVIRNLIHTRRRRGFAALFVAIPCLAWGLLVLALFIMAMLKGDGVEKSAGGFDVRFIAVPVTGVICLSTSVIQFRKAWRLSREMESLLLNNNVEMETIDPVDLSGSGIEEI